MTQGYSFLCVIEYMSLYFFTFLGLNPMMALGWQNTRYASAEPGLQPLHHSAVCYRGIGVGKPHIRPQNVG